MDQKLVKALIKGLSQMSLTFVEKGSADMRNSVGKFCIEESVTCSSRCHMFKPLYNGFKPDLPDDTWGSRYTYAPEEACFQLQQQSCFTLKHFLFKRENVRKCSLAPDGIVAVNAICAS